MLDSALSAVFSLLVAIGALFFVLALIFFFVLCFLFFTAVSIENRIDKENKKKRCCDDSPNR